jgi:hypothetical protein
LTFVRLVRIEVLKEAQALRCRIWPYFNHGGAARVASGDSRRPVMDGRVDAAFTDLRGVELLRTREHLAPMSFGDTGGQHSRTRHEADWRTR